MEEKVICQSTNKGGKIKLLIAICFFIVAAVLCLIYYPQYIEAKDNIDLYWRARESNRDLYMYESDFQKFARDPDTWDEENHDFFTRIQADRKNAAMYLNVAFLCIIISVLNAYKWFYAGRTSITITDKRIYGKAAFGKEVDLPLSSVVMIRKGGKKKMTISTSGGKVRFVGIKNRNEVYSAIQTLLAIR